MNDELPPELAEAMENPIQPEAVPYLESIQRFAQAYVNDVRAKGGNLNVIDLAIGRQLEAVHTEVLVTYLIDKGLIDLAELRRRLAEKMDDLAEKMKQPSIILGH